MFLNKNKFYIGKPDKNSPWHTFFSFSLTFGMVLIYVPIMQACFLVWVFGHYFDFAQIYMYTASSVDTMDWSTLEKKLFTSEQKYDCTDTFVFNLGGVVLAGILGSYLEYILY